MLILGNYPDKKIEYKRIRKELEKIDIKELNQTRSLDTTRYVNIKQKLSENKEYNEFKNSIRPLISHGGKLRIMVPVFFKETRIIPHDILIKDLINKEHLINTFDSYFLLPDYNGKSFVNIVRKINEKTSNERRFTYGKGRSSLFYKKELIINFSPGSYYDLTYYYSEKDSINNFEIRSSNNDIDKYRNTQTKEMIPIDYSLFYKESSGSGWFDIGDSIRIVRNKIEYGSAVIKKTQKDLDSINFSFHYVNEIFNETEKIKLIKSHFLIVNSIIFSEIKYFAIKDAITYCDIKFKEANSGLSILGLNVDKRIITVFGPLAILLLMIHFFLHIRGLEKFIINKNITEIEEPWFGIYQINLAKISIGIVYFLFPLLSALAIYLRTISVETNPIIPMLILITIAIFCFYIIKIIFRIRKKLFTNVPVKDPIEEPKTIKVTGFHRKQSGDNQD